jgi:hypothetical protein
MNRDPIEENGGLNLYGVVGNSPLINVDKLGKIPTLTLTQDKVDPGYCGSFAWKVSFATSPKLANSKSKRNGLTETT